MDEFYILGAVEENIGLNKSAFIKDPKLANCQIVRRPILFLWQKLIQSLKMSLIIRSKKPNNVLTLKSVPKKDKNLKYLTYLSEMLFRN